MLMRKHSTLLLFQIHTCMYTVPGGNADVSNHSHADVKPHRHADVKMPVDALQTIPIRSKSTTLCDTVRCVQDPCKICATKRSAPQKSKLQYLLGIFHTVIHQARWYIALRKGLCNALQAKALTTITAHRHPSHTTHVTMGEPIHQTHTQFCHTHAHTPNIKLTHAQPDACRILQQAPAPCKAFQKATLCPAPAAAAAACHNTRRPALPSAVDSSSFVHWFCCAAGQTLDLLPCCGCCCTLMLLLLLLLLQ
jgi:hypothetical protein